VWNAKFRELEAWYAAHGARAPIPNTHSSLRDWVGRNKAKWRKEMKAAGGQADATPSKAAWARLERIGLGWRDVKKTAADEWIDMFQQFATRVRGRGLMGLTRETPLHYWWTKQRDQWINAANRRVGDDTLPYRAATLSQERIDAFKAQGITLWMAMAAESGPTARQRLVANQWTRKRADEVRDIARIAARVVVIKAPPLDAQMDRAWAGMQRHKVAARRREEAAARAPQRRSDRNAAARKEFIPKQLRKKKRRSPTAAFAPLTGVDKRFWPAPKLLAPYLVRGSFRTAAALRRVADPAKFLNEPEQQPQHVEYVRLEKHASKGGSWGIVAKRDVRKNTTVALYFVRLKRAGDVRDSTYAIGIDGHPELTGDVCPHTVPPPTAGGIPFWGHFLNEPSVNEQANCEIGILHATSQVGGYMLVRVYTTRMIRDGDECTWCYGASYAPRRDYATSCV
jgi:hypothetical protein